MTTGLKSNDWYFHRVELLPSRSITIVHVNAKPNESLAISYGKVSLLTPSKGERFPGCLNKLQAIMLIHFKCSSNYSSKELKKIESQLPYPNIVQLMWFFPSPGFNTSIDNTIIQVRIYLFPSFRNNEPVICRLLVKDNTQNFASLFAVGSM